MARELDTATLDLAAKQWAVEFSRPTIWSKSNPEVAAFGRDWVMQCFYNAHFKDEFEYLLPKFKAQLGPDPLKEFEALAAERFKPRSDKVLKQLLAEKLATTPDGDHALGKIGTVQLGRRTVAKRVNRRGTVKDATWPIYAGEEEERAAGSGAVDPLPDPNKMFVNDEHLAPAAPVAEG